MHIAGIEITGLHIIAFLILGWCLFNAVVHRLAFRDLKRQLLQGSRQLATMHAAVLSPRTACGRTELSRQLKNRPDEESYHPEIKMLDWLKSRANARISLDQMNRQLEREIGMHFLQLESEVSFYKTVGPFWGLFFTAVGTVLALFALTQGADRDALFGGVALALITSAAGGLVMILESELLIRRLRPTKLYCLTESQERLEELATRLNRAKTTVRKASVRSESHGK